MNGQMTGLNWTIGETLAEQVTGPITRDDIGRFADASGDHNAIHMDDAIAKSAGLPGVIVHGMLNMAILGTFVSELAGQDRVKALQVRFKAMAFPGDRITCSGEVMEIADLDDGRTATLAVKACNQNDDVLLDGTAVVWI